MPTSLRWNAVEAIAEALLASYPETEPLHVSFPRLHQMIVGLDGFTDDPNAANERTLEAIQSAWYALLH